MDNNNVEKVENGQRSARPKLSFTQITKLKACFL